MNLTSNYHTHTPLCHHASGELHNYVRRAILCGMHTLGFSCHAPQITRDGFYSWYRMAPEDQAEYVASVTALREEFRGQIDIYLGYEVEYYPRHFDDTLRLLTRFPCDYLILGQHFTENEYDGVYSGTPTDDPNILRQYTSQVTEAMRLGIFTYVAHPDIINFIGSADEYRDAMSEVCCASVETDTPLEYNLLGFADGRWYPREEFWRIAGEHGCRAVIGCDAHSPDGLDAGSAADYAAAVLKKYGLTYSNDELILRCPNGTEKKRSERQNRRYDNI